MKKQIKAGHVFAPRPKCHPSSRQVPLPVPVSGALFGGRGRSMEKSDLTDNKIDIFVSLAGSAFSIAEEWYGTHIAWPMPDYHCWPIDVLSERANLVALWVRSGKRVMCACMGGHGRTGVLLGAILAVLGNSTPCETIWRTYCEKAIETDDQEAAVRYMANEGGKDELLKLFGTKEKPIARPPPGQVSYGYLQAHFPHEALVGLANPKREQ